MAIINAFKPTTIAETADCLAAYLPDGRLFLAKNIQGSNLRKLLEAKANEFNRLQNKIYEVSNEYDLTTTTNLIDQWESALGIPDGCLTNSVPITQRRLQVTAKFALMNLTTEEDWIALAEFFGYTITIDYGSVYDSFPIEFPIIFSGTAIQTRFSMVVMFMGLTKPSNIFSCRFPIYFGVDTNFLMCLFKRLKPANVQIHFRWEFE